VNPATVEKRGLVEGLGPGADDVWIAQHPGVLQVDDLLAEEPFSDRGVRGDLLGIEVAVGLRVFSDRRLGVEHDVGFGVGSIPFDIVDPGPFLVCARDPERIAGVEDRRNEIAIQARILDDDARVRRLLVEGDVVLPASTDDPFHLLLGHPGRPADLDGVGAARTDVFERVIAGEFLVGIDFENVIPLRPRPGHG
jgi:hypothetical protein